MSVTNNIVSKPITIREVAKLIGYSGNDLGRLCTHGNVNKWAKFKPVRFAKLFPVASDSHWFVNSDDTSLLWGMNVDGKNLDPSSTEAFDLYDLEATENWIYQKPNRTTDPKRLGDFASYNHIANPLLQMQDFEASMSEGIIYESEQTVYVGSNQKELPDFVQCTAMCSTSQHGVRIHEIARCCYGDTITQSSTDRMALVAHIYDYYGDKEIASYFADNIKLWDTSETKTSVTDTDYCDNYNGDAQETCRWMWVKFKLKNSEVWSTSGTRYKIIMTLSRVKRSSDKWIEEERFAVPFDISHYFQKHLLVKAVNRIIVPSQFYSDISTWSNTFSTTLPGFVQSPRIKFYVTRVPSETIVIGNSAGQYAIVSRHYRNGERYATLGKLINADGTTLSSIVIPAGSPNDAVDFHYEFLGALPFVTQRDGFCGVYTLELFIVQLTASFDVNSYAFPDTDRVGNVSITLK